MMWALHLTDRCLVGRCKTAKAAACLLAAAWLLSSCGSGPCPSESAVVPIISAAPGSAAETTPSAPLPVYSGRTAETTGSEPAPVASDARVLSLDAVVRLARQADALTWSDFDAYAYREIGSGLYIRQYEIDEQFELFIGGYQPDGKPLYIYLKICGRDDDRIDIRTGDVTAFIEQHRRQTAPPDPGRSEFG